MLIKGSTIKKYRALAKKIGLWDADYSSIKSDLIHIVNDVRNRDYAMDILGAAVVQISAIIRLVVYGNYEVGLSESDAKALFAPLECLDSTINAPYMLQSGIKKMIDELLPTVFATIEESADYTDFEDKLRRLMAGPSNITSIGLVYGIAMSISLRKFRGMAVFLEPLVDKLKQMLKKSDKFKPITKALRINFNAASKESVDVLCDQFAALFATAVVECNLNLVVSFDQMYELMSDIHKYGKVNSRFEQFINSKNFHLLMDSAKEYYEIST